MIPNSMSLLSGSMGYVAYQDGGFTDDDPIDDHPTPMGQKLKSFPMLGAKYDGDWSAAGSAIDFEMDNDVSFPSIVVDEEGTQQVAWMESLSGTRAIIAACLKGAE